MNKENCALKLVDEIIQVLRVGSVERMWDEDAFDCIVGSCEECSQSELRECETKRSPARTNRNCETRKHDGLPQDQTNDKSTRQKCRRTSSTSSNSARLHYFNSVHNLNHTQPHPIQLHFGSHSFNPEGWISVLLPNAAINLQRCTASKPSRLQAEQSSDPLRKVEYWIKQPCYQLQLKIDAHGVTHTFGWSVPNIRLMSQGC